MALDNIS